MARIPSITGRAFASSLDADRSAITAQLQFHMGVSESGIPLSPATLVLPEYAKYVNADLVEANLQLFGLGYCLATAPLTSAA